MKRATLTTALTLAVVACAMGVPSPAAAGVDWFGIGFSSGGFSFSLGFSDYPQYSDAWYSPSWSLNVDAALNGYGEWVVVPGLGRVWHPWVAATWQPFTYGRWVWTSLGWTWVAYEPWGYLPHHYGEWAYTGFGWVWVPGTVYRPANVVWLTSGSLIGWYPCAPHGWSNGHRAFVHGYDRGWRNGYDNGYADGWRDARYATWVDWRHLSADNVSSYAYSAPAAERAVSRSAVRPVAPPARADVERRGGVRVPEAQISRRDVRLGDRTVQAVRVEGLERDVRNNARATVERGLAPEVSRSLERREPVTRSVPVNERRPAVPSASVSERSSSGGRTLVTQPAARRIEVDRSAVSRDSGRSVIAPPRSNTTSRQPVVSSRDGVTSREPITVRAPQASSSSASRSRVSVTSRARTPAMAAPSATRSGSAARTVAPPASSRSTVTSRAAPASSSSSRRVVVAPRAASSSATVSRNTSAEKRTASSSSTSSRSTQVRRPTPRRQ